MATLHHLPTKFSISVPGKVILVGEHSVVYGHPAIAASLNLRTKVDYVLLEESNASQEFLRIRMSSINAEVSLSLSDMDHLVTSLASSGGWDFNTPQNADFGKLVEGVESFMKLRPYFQSLKFEQNLAIKVFLVLMVSILNRPNQTKLAGLKPCLIHLASDLPVGAGAGSSASYCVSVAALFLCIASLREKSVAHFCLDEKTKECISDWAFLGERITHGNPSGLDNNICTFGSLMTFRRPNKIVKIPLRNCVRVLLVDTKVSRNTRILVESIAKLKGHHDNIVTTIMQAMEGISIKAEKLFKLIDDANVSHAKEETANLFSRMEELWSINHSLLQALGVSHPSLEKIVQISREHNFVGKLTGAGGGGFAIILVPAGREMALAPLKEKLTKCGFGVNDVELGGPGVQLHFD